MLTTILGLGGGGGKGLPLLLLGFASICLGSVWEDTLHLVSHLEWFSGWELALWNQEFCLGVRGLLVTDWVGISPRPWH